MSDTDASTKSRAAGVRSPAPAAAPGGAGGRLPVRVTDRIQETPEAVSLVLDAELPYRPGQFLTVRVPSPGGAGAEARCYSLAGSPHAGDPLRITVKRVPGGVGSGWLCQDVRIGDELEILPPAGTFTPPDLDQDLLLVAGGSGITPVLSIAKSALLAGRGHVALVYANRDPGSVIFRDELWGLAEEHPGRLTVVHWLETLQGLPTAPQLGPLVAPYANRETYLCGPAPLMDAAETAIRSAGGRGRAIHRERYFSLSGDVFAPAGANPGEAAPDPGGATAEVEFEGVWHTVGWGRQTPLLTALLAAGVPAPYSCREGACSACCCRVLEGEVKMVRNEVLAPEDLAEGYVLACQALPLGDRIRISYDG
ncbi:MULTISPECIES: ferredoxin--NADP reductase [unclassified Streptomyces]|uniref:ferredoxin--NADP reductase n=1 Tax=unclassified Streptomyces TaxID=2593676 RepID=UPI0020306C70|nr:MULTISPECIES: ferredoxin--NADP reductase [unclassified Streptomyces]MCM1971440.1 ferredoxin--NADP reductase [Streptomyces sp. G1]MCX5299049.1 ferredoxin--NADP reductase [Streptomyces sp. NBC_00193]